MSVLKYYDDASKSYRALPLGCESVAVVGCNYSEDEQVVGCWIDGRPLYRKVITFTSPSSNTLTTFAHNIKNVDTIIITDHSYVFNNSDSIFYMVNSERESNTDFSIWLRATATGISGVFYGKFVQGMPTYVTLEYTKTTDAENSFSLDMLSSGDLDTIATDEEVAAVLDASAE